MDTILPSWNAWTQWFSPSTMKEKAPLWIFGDTMYDITYQGTYTKFANEAPIPVFYTKDSNSQRTVEPGGAYNVYTNVSYLDALCSSSMKPLYISIVGQDPFGETARKDLPEHEGHVILVDATRPTTLKIRYRVDDQLVFRHDIESSHPLSSSIEDQLIHSMQSMKQIPRGIVIADYGKGVCTSRLCQWLITYAHKHSIPIFIDPKQSLETYRNCTLLKLNYKELIQNTSHILSEGTIEENIQERCQWISQSYNIPYVLVTRSQHGACFYTPHSYHSFSIPSLPSLVRVTKDVVGAGDTIHTLISYWFTLLGGELKEDWSEIMPWILAVATGTVSHVGTSNISKVPLFQYYLDLQGKHVTREMLEWGVRWIRAHQPDLVIGWTNGCFDLFHHGHLINLEEAKNTCDFLIVAVNKDTSVKENKGPNRPIQGEKERAATIAALSCVSCVLFLEEKTPFSLIQCIKPDILYKGADYTVDKVIGKEYVGHVMLLDLVPNYSTSQLIERIKE